MSDILVVSSSQKGGELLCQLLGQQSGINAVYACGAESARKLMACSAFDAVIINTPLSDQDSQAFAKSLAVDSACGVIAIIRAEEQAEKAPVYEAMGVLVTEKPIVRPLFYQAVHMALVTRARLRALMDEKERLQSKIEETRLIDRAKCALIQYLRLTEPQAHRYIEKQAMDMRATRGQIAEGILQTYES